jgi:leader peptidase (prepilin peptidase)/N-methyltransferase
MFDLEKAIAEWRQQMLAAGIKTPVPLDELESHLRDDVDHQAKSGMKEQQAFEAAIQRIGHAGVLRNEFTKIDETTDFLRRKTVWLLMGVGFIACWLAFGQSPQLAFVYGIVFAGLLLASLIDCKHFIIPDRLSLGGVGLGLLCSFLLPQLHGQQFVSAGIVQSLLGIGVGAGLLYLILRAGKLAFGRERLALADGAKIVFAENALVLPDKEMPYNELFYQKSDSITLQARTVKLRECLYENVPVRLTPAGLHIGDDTFNPQDVSGLEATGSEIVLPREAMGMGDVKLMAAIGAFLGWQAVIFSLIVSSVIGSLVGCGLIAIRRRQWSNRLPYGPYIALAATIWIFAGKQLLTLFAP